MERCQRCGEITRCERVCLVVLACLSFAYVSHVAASLICDAHSDSTCSEFELADSLAHVLGGGGGLRHGACDAALEESVQRIG